MAHSVTRRDVPLIAPRPACHEAEMHDAVEPCRHDVRVEFSYRLTGPGWGEATLSAGDVRVVLPSSYLCDVLDDLLQALRALLEGASEARCSWELEPGEYRWLFSRDGDAMSLRILAFSDSWPIQADEDGEVLFRVVGPLAALATDVTAGIADVLATYGEADYKRQWINYPFPTEALNAVQGLLSAG